MQNLSICNLTTNLYRLCTCALCMCIYSLRYQRCIFIINSVGYGCIYTLRTVHATHNDEEDVDLEVDQTDVTDPDDNQQNHQQHGHDSNGDHESGRSLNFRLSHCICGHISHRVSIKQLPSVTEGYSCPYQSWQRSKL